MEASASPAPPKHRIPGLPNPVIATTQQKWIFSDEELERTPSRIDKIDREKEDYIRHRAVEFIWQVSMMLKMPPQTSMTATVFMHRFLMRYSLRGQYPEVGADLMHPKVIAAVSLFVAFKVDETMRRMKDFVVACCRVAMKQPDLVVDEQSKDYWKWRDLILQNESVMLEFLCFDLQLESPYRILWDYSLFLGVGDNRPLRHSAYAFLNDSTYTVLCLQFQPRVIAAAALYAAARHCQIAFPDDSEGRPWWEQLDVKVDELIRACKLIVKIYERVQQNLSKGYPDFAFSDADPNDPTRLFNNNPIADPVSTPTLSTPGDSAALNGRKRSREPDSQSNDHNQPTQTPTTQPSSSSLNGERSPKRQRTISPHPAAAAAAATASPSSSTARPRIPLRALEAVRQSKTTDRLSSENQDQTNTNKNTNTNTQSSSTQNPPKEETSAEEGEVSDDKGVDPSAAPPESKGTGLPPSAPRGDVNDEGGGSEEGEI
jgi:protein BUR2